MVKKIFFSLLSLLASLVGIWGVLNAGWTWEMAFTTAATLGFLAAALRTGNVTARNVRPEPPGERRIVTQRFEWGDLDAGSAASRRPFAG